jgi:hypothetical protein
MKRVREIKEKVHIAIEGDYHLRDRDVHTHFDVNGTKVSRRIDVQRTPPKRASKRLLDESDDLSLVPNVSKSVSTAKKKPRKESGKITIEQDLDLRERIVHVHVDTNHDHKRSPKPSNDSGTNGRETRPKPSAIKSRTTSVPTYPNKVDDMVDENIGNSKINPRKPRASVGKKLTSVQSSSSDSPSQPQRKLSSSISHRGISSPTNISASLSDEDLSRLASRRNLSGVRPPLVISSIAPVQPAVERSESVETNALFDNSILKYFNCWCLSFRFIFLLSALVMILFVGVFFTDTDIFQRHSSWRSAWTVTQWPIAEWPNALKFNIQAKSNQQNSSKEEDIKSKNTTCSSDKLTLAQISELKKALTQKDTELTDCHRTSASLTDLTVKQVKRLTELQVKNKQ